MVAIHEFPPREQGKEPRKAFLPVEARDSDERADLQLLRARLLDAAGTKSQDALRAAKQAYEARFPDEHEAIETLFGVVNFLDTQKTIEELRARDGRAPQELWHSLTEYNFTLTHFVETNGENRIFLDSFWRLFEDIGERWGGRGGVETVKKLHAGTVVQAGVSHAFKRAFYENVKSSLPDEDMRRATDLWVEGRPVQIKGAKRDKPEFIEVDTMTYPATVVRDGNQELLFTAHRDEKLDWLSLNVKRYSERIGRGMKAYFVVVPYRMVDWVTGEPTEELIEYFRAHAPVGSVSEKRREAA
ncbi:MAG: hypothetical protein Q7S84_00155 [bacterium]|nr:hypothetical protein [bacterium]